MYLAAAITGFILLGSSLSSLELKPGIPLHREVSTQTINTSGDEGSEPPGFEGSLSKSQTDIKPFIFASLFISSLVILILIISNLRKKDNVKTGFTLILIITTLMLLVFLLGETTGIIPEVLTEEVINKTQPSPFSFAFTKIGDPPEILFWVIKVVILLIIALLVFSGIFLWQRQKHSVNPLAAEAGSALHAIENGEDLNNVIIECYLKLLKIAQDERGIEREEHVTPREFEILLSSLGIPSAPIHQLTQLFEKVRYGKKAIDSNDATIAIECLKAIQRSNPPKKQVKK
ncbi:MAG: DUF4129 domain-containing protein [Anaerolineaceae bacterium]